MEWAKRQMHSGVIAEGALTARDEDRRKRPAFVSRLPFGGDGSLMAKMEPICREQDMETAFPIPSSGPGMLVSGVGGLGVQAPGERCVVVQ